MHTTRKSTVLMLEPHEDSRDMYVEYLRHNGITVQAVPNAARALAEVSDTHVLVMDVRLPGDMSGLELIARLRRRSETINTAIVVVSGGAFPHERERAQHAGCDVFLTKPCLPAMLLWHVRRMTIRQRGHRHLRPTRDPIASVRWLPLDGRQTRASGHHCETI